VTRGTSPVRGLRANQTRRVGQGKTAESSRLASLNNKSKQIKTDKGRARWPTKKRQPQAGETFSRETTKVGQVQNKVGGAK